MNKMLIYHELYFDVSIKFFYIFQGLPENTILPALKQSLMDFKEFLPTIISLRNPCLQRRHWEAIQNIVGQTVSFSDKKLTLEKILTLDVIMIYHFEVMYPKNILL